MIRDLSVVRLYCSRRRPACNSKMAQRFGITVKMRVVGQTSCTWSTVSKFIHVSKNCYFEILSSSLKKRERVRTWPIEIQVQPKKKSIFTANITHTYEVD
jgi:hypothetical protein